MTETRTDLVKAAARLFRTQGYAATGLNEILAEAGASRGSLYHHFPEGKEAIGAAAVERSGERILQELQRLADEAASAEALVRAAFDAMGENLAGSGFTNGCPIATTVLEQAPGSSLIQTAAASAYASWQAVFTQAVAAEGASADQAARLGLLTLSAMQGALMLSRTLESVAPLEMAATEITCAMRAACAHEPSE